jgi:hypothetical protein
MTTTNTFPRFFTSDDFESAARFALGKASQGTMDVGIVYSTLDRVTDGDPASWLTEWSATADSLRTQALAAKAAGRVQTASYFFLAASDCYVRANEFIDGLDDQSQLLPLFLKHRENWDEFIALSGGRFLPLNVPYEGDSMPGYLLRSDASGAKRPTVVFTNGSDGSLSGLWAEGIKSCLERGFNVYVFDGPGQQSMLFERNIPFRYDWEAVLTPVLDELGTRDDVDETAFLAYGISQGGYWLGRALAFEHRFVAAVVDGGVVDVSRSWNSNLPQPMLDLLASGDEATFNTYMSEGPTTPEQQRTIGFRARPYGGIANPFELFTDVQKFRLTSELLAAITTPTLVMDPDDEQFFPGQPRDFFDGLTAQKELAHFSREDGANIHCQPLARTLTGLRMNDFFDAQLALADR